jgi:hypothetical protein
MKTVTLGDVIRKFPNTEFKTVFSAAQKDCWERHNSARNQAHADYSNPKYIPNRLAADKAWATESDEIVDAFQKVVGYLPKLSV